MEHTLAGVNDYLLNHIPLTRHLGARVVEFDETSVRLTAPLAPNLNHRETAFGGSIASLAILAGWTLCHLRLTHAQLNCRLVIQHTRLDFLLPIAEDFEVISSCTDPGRWEKLFRGLTRKGRGRIELTADIRAHGQTAASFTGAYAALTLNQQQPPPTKPDAN